MFLRNRPIDLTQLSARNFWSRAEVAADDDCWLWRLAPGTHGYGQVSDGSGTFLAHRAAWALANGRQVPDGMTIDHVCHVRMCVNPAHLRPLPNVDNARDNLQAFKTHCPQGHPYAGTNLIVYTNPKGQTCRKCRRCHHELLDRRKAERATRGARPRQRARAAA